MDQVTCEQLAVMVLSRLSAVVQFNPDLHIQCRMGSL